MAEGRLYEVDMRLRPSGRQGPVATAWDAFKAYQETDAWTWEHLALTRARGVAGPPALLAEVEAFRRDLLERKGRGSGVRADVSAMRDRLQASKPGVGAWDARDGPGRMMDIELCAQMLALMSGSPAPDVEGQIAAAAVSILSEPEQTALGAGYKLLWRLRCATRLLTDGVLDLASLGEGGRAFLLRETQVADVAGLAVALDQVASAADAVITALLGRGERRDGSG